MDEVVSTYYLIVARLTTLQSHEGARPEIDEKSLSTQYLVILYGAVQQTSQDSGIQKNPRKTKNQLSNQPNLRIHELIPIVRHVQSVQ